METVHWTPEAVIADGKKIGRMYDDFKWLKYFNIPTQFEGASEGHWQEMGMGSLDVELLQRVDAKFRLFNTSAVYEVGDALPVRMILDSEVSKRHRDPTQLHHAMRCIFLYMFYAKVKEVHGAIPLPIERLTPTGALSHMVTRPNPGLREMLGRIGHDWVSFVDGCMEVLAHHSNDVSTGATGGRLLFDTFVQARTAAMRADSLLNLGTFTSHVSLLIQNGSEPLFSKLYDYVTDRESKTEDLELKQLLRKCLNQSQATKMDNPFVWAQVVSPILLLDHYKLENQFLTGAVMMEYLVVDRQRKRPTALVNLENIIWKQVLLAADGRQTLADAVKKIVDLHGEMAQDLQKTTKEERAYFANALEPPELAPAGKLSDVPESGQSGETRPRTQTDKQAGYPSEGQSSKAKPAKDSELKKPPVKKSKRKARSKTSSKPSGKGKAKSQDEGLQDVDDRPRKRRREDQNDLVANDKDVNMGSPARSVIEISSDEEEEELGSLFWTLGPLTTGPHPPPSLASVEGGNLQERAVAGDAGVFEIEMWGGGLSNGTHSPFPYKVSFPPGPDAGKEMAVFKAVWNNVVSNYVDDPYHITETHVQIPLHALPNAGDASGYPSAERSMFFVTTAAEWGAMSKARQNEVFQRFRIVMQNTALETQTWDLENMMTITHGRTHVSAHNMARRTTTSFDAENVRSLLEDVVEEGDKPLGDGAALAVLDVPDRAHLVHDLLSTKLDDGLKAWEDSVSMTEMKSNIRYPHLATNWWLFHTGRYVSRIHMDADGAATIVVVPPGCRAYAGKLWIVGRPKCEEGDVRYTTGASSAYDPWGANGDLFKYEAVWLRAGDCLMMHPGDFHIVLTTDTTIAYGGHFFPAVHLVKTVSCLASALFAQHWTTNIAHVEFFRVILRFLPSWARHLDDSVDDSQEDDKHRLDFGDVEDVSQLMAVGCLAVFLKTLIQRPPDCKEKATQPPIRWRERRAFRGYFLQILLHFSEHYEVSQGADSVSLLSLLEETLSRFANAILDVAVRIDGMQVDEETAQEVDLEYVEPERVRASLEYDLDMFWPGRQWSQERKLLRLPTAEQAKVPRQFIDLDGKVFKPLAPSTGPVVDWSQFGISPPDTAAQD